MDISHILKYNISIKKKEEIMEQPTKDSFIRDIQKYMLRNPNLKYLDAIAHLCEQYEIEFSVVGKLIDGPMKDKIRAEAIELNYLKKFKGGQLPI